MAYSKKIPPIKLMVSKKEYNYLIGVLNENIENSKNDEIVDIAKLTKEKLLKFSVPRINENQNLEIDIRLYINEAIDIISQFLNYVENGMSEINYYELLQKMKGINL